MIHNETQVDPELNKRAPATLKIMQPSTKMPPNRLTTRPYMINSYKPLLSYSIFKIKSTSNDNNTMTSRTVSEYVKTTDWGDNIYTHDDDEISSKVTMTMQPSTLYLADMFRGVFKTEYVFFQFHFVIKMHVYF